MTYTKISELPSPKGHLILGHLPQFNTESKHLVLERWVEECGDLFKINFVGKPFIVSANHEMNEQILRMRPEVFRRFNKITEILEEMGILGVFNAEGKVWEKHRKPTSEALNLKNVRSFYPIIELGAGLSVRRIKNWMQHSNRLKQSFINLLMRRKPVWQTIRTGKKILVIF